MNRQAILSGSPIDSSFFRKFSALCHGSFGGRKGRTFSSSPAGGETRTFFLEEKNFVNNRLTLHARKMRGGRGGGKRAGINGKLERNGERFSPDNNSSDAGRSVKKSKNFSRLKDSNDLKFVSRLELMEV